MSHGRSKTYLMRRYRMRAYIFHNFSNKGNCEELKSITQESRSVMESSDMVLESFRLVNENEIIMRPRDVWHEYLALLVAPMKFVTLELHMRSRALANSSSSSNLKLSTIYYHCHNFATNTNNPLYDLLGFYQIRGVVVIVLILIGCWLAGWIF